MKGTILICCFKDLIEQKYGKSKWKQVLEMSGLPADTVFIPTEKASDEVVMNVLHNVCKVIGISVPQATDAFGEYWVNSFLPRLYPNFGIIVSNSRDFLVKLNDIHAKIAKTMQGAAPTKFVYRWKDEDTLLIAHESKWLNSVLLVGLLKGAAKYFGEELSINLWSSNQMMVKFPSAAAAVLSESEEVFRLEERQA